MNALREEAIDIAATIIEQHYFRTLRLRAHVESNGNNFDNKSSKSVRTLTTVSIGCPVPGSCTPLLVDFYEEAALLVVQSVDEPLQEYSYTRESLSQLYKKMTDECRSLPEVDPYDDSY
jgi:hypothetical protein